MNGFYRNQGFTLLEAIVALVIFASVGTALYAWIGVNLNGLSRVEASRQKDEATQVALAMLSTVNPAVNPEGTLEVAHYTVHWEGEVLRGPEDGLAPGGDLSLYEVSLYELSVEVLGASDPVNFSTRKAGWVQVRQAQSPF